MRYTRYSRSTLMFIAPTLLALMLVLACGPAAPPATAPAATPQETTSGAPTATAAPSIVLSPGGLATTPTPLPQVTKRLRVLNVAQIGNPVSLTCSERAATDEYDSITYFMEPIFQFNHEAKLEGVVAESFEMRSPTEWIIRIRPGMKFHGPEYGELTAEDVVASIDDCYREDGPRISQIPSSIVQRQVEILDDYTIKVTLAEPGTAALPNYLSDVAVTAKGYLEKMKADSSLRERPMGTGPLVFKEWAPNVRIVGERFEDYWGPEIAMDRVVWKIITDPFTRKSELLTGGVDILPFVIPEWVDEIDAAPNVRIESTISSRYLFIGLPAR
jgi:ABC-type transport system substrate-binding protein